jgi:hypothetical protein
MSSTRGRRGGSQEEGEEEPAEKEDDREHELWRLGLEGLGEKDDAGIGREPFTYP